MVAFVSLKREAIHGAVRQMYAAVATSPDREFHFPTGRRACEVLGYPDEQLTDLPDKALESFAGVGYPFAAGVLGEGDTVLDIGSGSGTDTLISAKVVGAKGRVYALDMTVEMRAKLTDTAAAAGMSNIEVIEGDAESIPLPDESVDVVTTNGVINLVPDKARAIGEIFRVLKPGGRLQISDIALDRPVAERFRQDPQMWAECVVGAVEEDRYLIMLRSTGFDKVQRIDELDYFALSANSKTKEVAELFNAHSITIRALKPVTALRPPVEAGVRRAGRNAVRELAGVVVASLAWLTCAGVPALLAAFGAIGAGGLAGHAYMFPVFAGFLGFSVWLLWRSGRARSDLRPFWVAFGSAVLAILTTWLSILGIVPWAGWVAYPAIAGVIGASVWSYILGRQPGNCLEEMIFEVRQRERRGTLARRLAADGLAVLVASTLLYGLHLSITAFGIS
ncbi:MAG: methyltransferase domain-containing protein [Betaproteobacteria bacterium]|jgi:SAM-dependent methyltransferase|nr:MAG: methyltransferase domain-containing protein [Betaproteobacteria bacterium]